MSLHVNVSDITLSFHGVWFYHTDNPATSFWAKLWRNIFVWKAIFQRTCLLVCAWTSKSQSVAPKWICPGSHSGGLPSKASPAVLGQRHTDRRREQFDVRGGGILLLFRNPTVFAQL